MRRVYRAFGGLRLIVGAIIFAIGFSGQDALAFGPSTFLMLIGTLIALSGAINAFLVVLCSILYPVALFSVGWLTSFGWEDGTLVQYISGRLNHVGFGMAAGLISMPLMFWHMNKSWWLMTDRFSLDEPPSDTANKDAFDWGQVEICGDYFVAAVTLTHQGIILDRRNFAAVVLPWNCIRKIKPILDPDRVAELSLANDDGDLLLVDVPWNPAFFQLVPDGVPISGS